MLEALICASSGSTIQESIIKSSVGTSFPTLYSEDPFAEAPLPVPVGVETPLKKVDGLRYARQMVLPEIGTFGQARLQSARVLVIGAGGLGCAVLQALAGAGVGRIGIVDGDVVEVTNLHRQPLHTEASAILGVSKAISASAALRSLNSSIEVIPYPYHLTPDNATKTAVGYGYFVDCTDNAPTRYLISDLAAGVGSAGARRPLISGAALRWDGQVSVYCAGPETPCYRCIHPVPPGVPSDGAGAPSSASSAYTASMSAAPQSCGEAGVVGAVPALIGNIQALEAIKVMLKLPLELTLAGRLLAFSGVDMRTHVVKLRPRNPSCAGCSSDKRLRFADLRVGAVSPPPCASILAGRLGLPPTAEIGVDELAAMFRRGAPHIVYDVRKGDAFVVASLARTPGAVAVSLPLGRWDSTTPGVVARVTTEKGRSARGPMKVY